MVMVVCDVLMIPHQIQGGAQSFPPKIINKGGGTIVHHHVCLFCILGNVNTSSIHNTSPNNGKIAKKYLGPEIHS